MSRFSSFFHTGGRLCKYCVPFFFQKQSNLHTHSKMPPVPDNTNQWLHKTIDSAAIILFSKSRCPYCQRVKDLFAEKQIKHATIELDQRGKFFDGCKIQEALQLTTGISTVPQVFVRGKFIGDSAAVSKLNESGKLLETVNQNKYDYDLVVIGGGSGGLAASKEAAKYGAKTAVLDYVKPTPQGTTWGLGGTCVNVGCIPKKLMHQAALLGYSFADASHFGWGVENKQIQHDWGTLVGAIQGHIRSLNWGYRVVLRDQGIDYLNVLGEIVDPHTIQLTKKNGDISTITTNTIILAMGERPRYPGIPGDKEYAITSDDLFSLPYNPGKTLVVGASYVSLECAGFLTSFGNDTTVMVRSIFLRGFDQQMANMIGTYMMEHGTKFVRSCVPTAIRELEPADKENGRPGRYLVTGKFNNGDKYEEEFNTVVLAIGRDPCVDKAVMDKLGVKLDKSNRVVCSPNDQSSVSNIYAIGDINSGKPQLTPVAIQAGRYLARRLYTGSTELTDYVNVATTVFTPLEYGAIGMSEEDAIAKYGKENIDVYHSHFNPLEWALPHRDDNVCYAKLVCNKADNERVIGLHVIGPNAGEITQGYAVALKMGATKADFDRTIGIHPTCSETFTTLHVTKSSGVTAKVTGC
ncbi:hypothetical protein EG68_04880 [Paragonimus skrjabini miyazakii]|uniref:thioredoxin-disulfide reductase (NADPH) n=1 Tax=Paragonimus skrjabini miyazakii TaxID=59628 RepID=A0A8S9Z069_9TREM|nr:hypothetical protein EG68_04880 [Paragonimus skrjabini miyazakii]